jgi:hypothetical protein
MYKSNNCENGKWRRVTYLNDSVKDFLESEQKEMTANRPYKVSISTVMKKHLNEAYLCKQITNKSVWQIIKENIELKKKINNEN